MTRPSVLALITIVNILVGWPCPPLEAGPNPDAACRSLAALYARMPEYFDVQDLSALQTCIGTAQSELQPVQAQEPPMPTAVPPPVGPQRVDRFKGVWSESAPWTTPGDPYPTVW